MAAPGRHAGALRALALLACVASCTASGLSSSFKVGGNEYYCQAQAFQARQRKPARLMYPARAAQRAARTTRLQPQPAALQCQPRVAAALRRVRRRRHWLLCRGRGGT
jgi:hypothetical protein